MRRDDSVIVRQQVRDIKLKWSVQNCKKISAFFDDVGAQSQKGWFRIFYCGMLWLPTYRFKEGRHVLQDHCIFLCKYITAPWAEQEDKRERRARKNVDETGVSNRGYTRLRASLFSVTHLLFFKFRFYTQAIKLIWPWTGWASCSCFVVAFTLLHLLAFQVHLESLTVIGNRVFII